MWESISFIEIIQGICGALLFSELYNNRKSGLKEYTLFREERLPN